ncbi:ankyrin [Fusarium albosuccineum]|uniref:Ankyrin n=1 Tax=Fusarium albosuccineum TaxID=1237068 RepID=A0A8H4L072_9HYPO|nr:ankyrin [Fusarium albosuccineum]
MNAQQFVHTPLDKTTPNIRLLQIRPYQSDNDRPICSITTHTLDNECPPFIALSYVWGRDKATNDIELDARTFRVRSNLWSALHQLSNCQLDVEAEYFWIDAICINQEDNDERAHQVGMMSKIYQGAAAVVAWLGPSLRDSDIAIKAIGQLSPDLEPGQEPADKRSRDALRNLFHRPYFRRLWVVQEVVLAKKVWVMCGRLVCSWGQLQKTLDWSSQTYYASQLIRAKQGDWGYHLEREPLTLDKLMLSVGSRECTDAKDKVYALLSLVPRCEIHSDILPVDYGVSREELFYRVTRYLRETHCWRLMWPYSFDIPNYDRIGEQLQIPRGKIVSHGRMQSVVGGIQQLAAVVPMYTKYPHREPWASMNWNTWLNGWTTWILRDLDELLNSLGIKTSSIDNTYESIMRNGNNFGGPDGWTGWTDYEREIKVALRLRNGETWDRVGFVLKKASGCSCPSDKYLQVPPIVCTEQSDRSRRRQALLSWIQMAKSHLGLG